VERAEKAELVTSLNTVFKDADVVIVAHYAGLTVAKMTQLRRRMKDVGGSVKVAKNRLARLALKGTDAAGIADLFTGPTVLAYSKDPVGTAKVMATFAKENDKLVILGASMGTAVLDPNGVKTLAELPSLDELRAKILGLIQAPAGKIARLIAEPGSQLARVIKAYSDQAEKAA
jgi:large subunit ribosomal protein L10